MAPRTVKEYCRRIYEKYHISDLSPHCKRARLVAIVVDRKFSETAAVLKPTEEDDRPMGDLGKNQCRDRSRSGQDATFGRELAERDLRKDRDGKPDRAGAMVGCEARRCQLQRARAGVPTPHYFFRRRRSEAVEAQVHRCRAVVIGPTAGEHKRDKTARDLLSAEEFDRFTKL